ncbi:hypothetical protein Q8F55_008791 [Vanrija albida]|uniref:Thioredoxin domain-containing protein n=1 Tax=Vanrija albida TaxID=181172 RepID=A0ABR3PS54_9TREE
MHLPTLVALAVAPLLAAAGMYREPAIELNAKTYKQVMAKEHASLVAFVAPWCGHCKSLAPEYTAAAASLSPLIPFYYVDCDQAQNKGLCGELGIQGFPSIKAFPRAGKSAPRDYNGQRQRGDLIEYAKLLIPDRVRKLRASADDVDQVLDKFLAEKPTQPHALLIHPSAPSIPFLWKVLGARLQSKAFLGYIRDTPKHSVLSAVDVYDANDSGDTARVVVWEAGEKAKTKVVEYNGALKFNALLEWLEAVLDGKAPPPQEKVKESKKAAKADESNQSESEAKAEESEPAKPSAADAEKEKERRAKLQAKMDEAERRDKARREKLAAKKAAEQAAASDEGTPVEDAPAAEPEDVTEKEEEQLVVPVEEPETASKKTAPTEEVAGTPVDDAAAPEPEEDAEDEERSVHDEL